MSNWRRAVFWFCVQAVQYGLLVSNGRAFVQGSYLWTALTDGLIAANGFWLFGRFQEDAGKLNRMAMAGYVLGGVAGSLAAIWITKHLYGQ